MKSENLTTQKKERLQQKHTLEYKKKELYKFNYYLLPNINFNIW